MVFYYKLNKVFQKSSSENSEAHEGNQVHSIEKCLNVWTMRCLSVCEEQPICLFLLASISAPMASCISENCIIPGNPGQHSLRNAA